MYICLLINNDHYDTYLNELFFTNRITRFEDSNSSNIKVFSTQFYLQLKEFGPEAVQSWTEKKNIDVFEKKFVVIPIGKSLHWILVVIVNPGHLPMYFRDGVGNPFLLILDSSPFLNYNKIRDKLSSWLTREGLRLQKFSNNDDLNERELPMLKPEG